MQEANWCRLLGRLLTISSESPVLGLEDPCPTNSAISSDLAGRIVYLHSGVIGLASDARACTSCSGNLTDAHLIFVLHKFAVSPQRFPAFAGKASSEDHMQECVAQKQAPVSSSASQYSQCGSTNAPATRDSKMED